MPHTLIRALTRSLAALVLSGAALAAAGGTAHAAQNALEYTVDGGPAQYITDPQPGRCHRLNAPEGSQVTMRNNTDLRLAIYAGYECGFRLATVPPRFGEARVRGLYSVAFFPR